MVGFPVLTGANIAAACAGDWTSAEKHHLASIARMEAVPYVTHSRLPATGMRTGWPNVEALETSRRPRRYFRLPSPRAMRSGSRGMRGWRGGGSRNSRKRGPEKRISSATAGAYGPKSADTTQLPVLLLLKVLDRCMHLITGRIAVECPTIPDRHSSNSPASTTAICAYHFIVSGLRNRKIDVPSFLIN